MNDYYAILGASPSAEPDALRRAFRARVMQCHPDRGGTHAEMVRVNEAWQVLSDPESRQRYDEARKHVDDRAKQDAASFDIRQAQHTAKDYPRTWNEFERWFDSVAGDFTNARYGSRKIWFGEIEFPTASKSISAILFILGGALIGLILAVAIIATFVHFKLPGNPVGPLCLLLIAGGAWAGAKLHRWIGTMMSTSKRVPGDSSSDKRQRDSKASATDAPSGADVRGGSTAKSQPVSFSHVVACEKCGQKLKVPAVGPKFSITCKKCHHTFAFSP